MKKTHQTPREIPLEIHAAKLRAVFKEPRLIQSRDLKPALVAAYGVYANYVRRRGGLLDYLLEVGLLERKTHWYKCHAWPSPLGKTLGFLGDNQSVTRVTLGAKVKIKKPLYVVSGSKSVSYAKK